jgi:hypothetical protein
LQLQDFFKRSFTAQHLYYAQIGTRDLNHLMHMKGGIESMKTKSMTAVKTSILLAMLAFSGTARADDIYLGTPAYGGTGCPQGTASAALSPDSKSLSILFDQFAAEAGDGTGKTMDRKSCNVAIPVHVPQGYSVSVIGIDYRGFNSLPSGGSSTFSVEYFFAGLQGPRYSKTFRGPLNDDYMLRNELVATALVWSACGADVNLRTNMNVRATTNRNFEQALATVDSADISAGIIYQLQWKRCF